MIRSRSVPGLLRAAGTGLPTASNTHEVAQRIAPDARVVYADNDPMVLLHARALATSARRRWQK